MPSKMLDVQDLVPWVGNDKNRPKGRGKFEHAFNQMFSLREKMESTLRLDGASMGVDPHFDARQTLCCIGRMPDAKLTRALVQLDDETEGLCVDLVQYQGKDAWRTSDCEDPILFVRYAYTTRHGRNLYDNPLEAVQAIGASMPPGNLIQSIKCASREEMQVLNKTLEANMARIPQRLREDIENSVPKSLLKIPNSCTSFITLLKVTDEKDAPPPCKLCGARGVKVCSNCKVARYCSKLCQRQDWKAGHKTECKTPETLAEEGAGNVITGPEVDENWVDIDPTKTPKEIGYGTTFSMITSCAQNPKIREAKKVLDGIKPDKMMTVKVQIIPGSSALNGQPMLIYPQGKRFEMSPVSQCFLKGDRDYNRLHNLIQNCGHDAGLGMGGCKAYMNAYVTKEGMLRLMLNELKPMQKW